mgnify:CR=1 FL=1
MKHIIILLLYIHKKCISVLVILIFCWPRRLAKVAALAVAARGGAVHGGAVHGGATAARVGNTTVRGGATAVFSRALKEVLIFSDHTCLI